MLDLAVVDLAARPDLAGQVVYLFAQARVLLPKTSLDLAADVGAGWQRSSGFETNEAKNGWWTSPSRAALAASVVLGGPDWVCHHVEPLSASSVGGTMVNPCGIDQVLPG